MLKDNQIQQYRDDGFIIVNNRIPQEEITRINAEIDRLVLQAGGIENSNDIYDLEDSHTPETPRVRRIKLPHEVSPVFDNLMRSEWILEPVRDLLGSSLRLHTSKLNLKAAGYGAAVEWHQDWAFYPHTNQDVLAVGVMLNDMHKDNGPLMMIPGSHKRELADHHVDGHFCGAIAADDPLLNTEPVALTGAAGSISIHHARTIHGSDLNRSNKNRALLLYEITAADAWPIMGSVTEFGSLQEFDKKMLCGEPTLHPRLESVPVRMPLPQKEEYSSIYNAQKESGKRAFSVYAQ